MYVLCSLMVLVVHSLYRSWRGGAASRSTPRSSSQVSWDARGSLGGPGGLQARLTWFVVDFVRTGEPGWWLVVVNLKLWPGLVRLVDSGKPFLSWFWECDGLVM